MGNCDRNTEIYTLCYWYELQSVLENQFTLDRNGHELFPYFDQLREQSQRVMKAKQRETESEKENNSSVMVTCE